MDEILHRLGALNYCNSSDFTDSRWCKIISINGMSPSIYPIKTQSSAKASSLADASISCSIAANSSTSLNLNEQFDSGCASAPCLPGVSVEIEVCKNFCWTVQTCRTFSGLSLALGLG